MYFLGFPLEKIFISSLFVLYKLILLFLLFYLWGIFFVSGYRLYIYSAVFAAAALGAFFIFTFFYSLGYSEHKIEVNANDENLAFVLGAAVWQHDKPSPMFEGRIKKSLELYNKGVIGKIQVTGSNAPGELSEAKTAYKYLLRKGVVGSDILIEENSASTHDQIQYLMKNESNYKKRFNNIILISDEFHMVRIKELCKYYKLEVLTVTSDYELKWQKLLYYRIRETVALFLFWLFGI
jgi:vancomycin permeability regulator SanA